MKLRPIRNRVAVVRDDETDTSDGGIVIVKFDKEKPIRGTVLAIGGDVTVVKEGDHVMFGKYAGDDVKIDDVDVVFVKDSDLIAVFEE